MSAAKAVNDAVNAVNDAVNTAANNAANATANNVATANATVAAAAAGSSGATARVVLIGVVVLVLVRDAWAIPEAGRCDHAGGAAAVPLRRERRCNRAGPVAALTPFHKQTEDRVEVERIQRMGAAAHRGRQVLEQRQPGRAHT